MDSMGDRGREGFWFYPWQAGAQTPFTDRQGRLRLHLLTEKGNREGLRLHPVIDKGAREGLRLHKTDE